VPNNKNPITPNSLTPLGSESKAFNNPSIPLATNLNIGATASIIKPVPSNKPFIALVNSYPNDVANLCNVSLFLSRLSFITANPELIKLKKPPLLISF